MKKVFLRSVQKGYIRIKTKKNPENAVDRKRFSQCTKIVHKN